MPNGYSVDECCNYPCAQCMSSFNVELPQANTRAGIRLIRSHLGNIWLLASRLMQISGLPQMANFTPLGEPRWKRDPADPSSSQAGHAASDFVGMRTF